MGPAMHVSRAMAAATRCDRTQRGRVTRDIVPAEGEGADGSLRGVYS
jgi:hypothetical protein